MIKPLTRPAQTFDLLTPEQETCHRFLRLIEQKITEALLAGCGNRAKYLRTFSNDAAEFAREVMEEDNG